MSSLTYGQVHALALRCGAQTYGDLKDKPVQIHNSAIIACSADLRCFGEEYAATRLSEVMQQRVELLEALKAVKDALDHMWREVPMNECDFEKLNEAISNSEAVISKVEVSE